MMTKREETIVEWFAGIAIGVLFGALLIVSTVYSQPATVYEEWPSGECVDVQPVEAGSCDNLPANYRHVWAAPKEDWQ